MNKRVLRQIVLLAGLFLSAASPAFAGNWWSYDWSIDAVENGYGYGNVSQAYDQIAVWYKSGDSMDNPVFTNLTDGWTAVQDSLTNAYLLGSETTGSTSFTLNFYGSQGTSNLLYMTSDEGTVTGRWLATISSCGITTRELTACEWESMGGGNPLVTPEPVSAALFVIGGVGLFYVRYKKKNDFFDPAKR